VTLRLPPVCLVLLALALAASPAIAEGPDHPWIDTITVGPPDTETFKDACGVAVDAEGYVYVANYYRRAIDIFDDFHNLVAQIANDDPLGGLAEEPLDGPCDLAVDAAGSLYVNNWHRDVVKLSPSHFPPDGSVTYSVGAVIDSDHPTSVAIDPATGNVYVDDRTYVAEYEPSGAPVLSAGEPVRIGLGSLGDGYGVAASAGQVYVADAADNTVKVYRPADDPLVPAGVINGAGTPQGSFYLSDSDLAVGPDGHLYVTDNLQPGFEHPELAVDEFSAFGHYRGRLPHPAAEGESTNMVHGVPSGIAVAANGNVYVTSGNDVNAEVRVFGPAAPIATQILTVEKSGAGSGTVARVPPGWLRCGGACEGEFDQESNVELIATPVPHSRFVGWNDCPSASGPSSCTVSMDADHTVGAEFEPIPQQALGVTRSGSGGGVVVSSPAGIDCGLLCSGEFDEASQVTLTAAAAEGSRFSGWSGCDTEPGAGKCRLTISASRSVVAEFEAIPPPSPPSPPAPSRRTLAVASTAVGAAAGVVTSEPAGIDCGGVCAHVYDEGVAVTLVAHPAPGSSFLGWGGCDSADGDRCRVALGTDKSVVAAFGPGFPGRLRLRGLLVRGPIATLRVAVPGPGVLSASGRGLRSSSALALAATEVPLRLRLTAAALRAFRGASRRPLEIKVSLTFVPFDGGSTVGITRTVVFGGGKRRR
jgi:DNA-binding beta-propeller fold protein YncE